VSVDGSGALWLTVIAFGVYHGLNPSMGWPLAVAAGLTARRTTALFATLLPLGGGHLLAMAVAVLPFALLAEVLQHGREIRIGAGALVLLFGVYRLVDRRHPRYLARIRPTRLAWWAFVMATAHGGGLMLVPVALGLCATAPPDAAGPLAFASSIRPGLASGVGVVLVHTVAMLLSGVAIAWLVYRWLGLQFLRRAWFDLDVVWGVSLVVSGGVGCAIALSAAR